MPHSIILHTQQRTAFVKFSILYHLSLLVETHRVTHLSLRRGHGSPAWVDLFIDAGQEVLGYSQSILKQREVWVILRSVFQQVLKKVTK